MTRHPMTRFLFPGIVAFLLLVPCARPGDPKPTAEPTARVLAALEARSIGPANMGGRITDVAVVESDPRIMYVAAATGGVWKTADAGKTWASVFDRAGSLCIGDVAVAPSNPDIVWVGTGEANIMRSTSCGDGVWKSTDGGKTWQHMGLKDTRHIGRVVIHPKNPDIVYVAAIGHAWGPNRERGLYKTEDGGKTWLQTKYINDTTGFIDVAIDPSEPDTLYAAAYTVQRDAFSGMAPRVQWSAESGLFKTVDGGKTWTRMTSGLPQRPIGRCGLAVYPKNPSIVYAVVQTDRTGPGFGGKGKGGKAKAEKPSPDAGGVFRSDDGGKTWELRNPICPGPQFFYGQIRVDPNDDQRVYVLGVPVSVSSDGGRTFSTMPMKNVHVDHHALWIDPKDSNHLVLGNDGGLYFSKDKGKTWGHIRGMAIGQYYAVGVDMRRPYHIYGGTQDNGTWGGPSATDSADGITLANWTKPLGSDGFYAQVDPTDPMVLYCESQYGGLRRIHLDDKKGSKSIKPQAPKGQAAYRFNWNSPILLSPHDPKTVYFGGNFLFRSHDRGDKWETLSPDLTRGGKAADTGHTITTIAESPLRKGLLWAGTDDGRVHVSKNDGKGWIDVTDNIPGPKDRWVTRVECSHHDEATAYVTIDRHRNDDLTPYVWKTTDYGDTWVSLAAGLPKGVGAGPTPVGGPVHVIRESSKNKSLLFVGTEWGLFASTDAGKTWHHLKNGIPAAVTVHDLVIHPRDRELVIGTHGRSLYVMDISPLEELTPKVLASDMHLFRVRPAVAFKVRAATESGGYRAPNPPYGAVIHYYLKSAPKGPVSLTVEDAGGKAVATLSVAKSPGLHRAVWDLRASGENGGLVEPGEYTARLRAGGEALTTTVRVERP